MDRGEQHERRDDARPGPASLWQGGRRSDAAPRSTPPRTTSEEPPKDGGPSGPRPPSPVPPTPYAMKPPAPGQPTGPNRVPWTDPSGPQHPQPGAQSGPQRPQSGPQRPQSGPQQPPSGPRIPPPQPEKSSGTRAQDPVAEAFLTGAPVPHPAPRWVPPTQQPLPQHPPLHQRPTSHQPPARPWSSRAPHPPPAAPPPSTHEVSQTPGEDAESGKFQPAGPDEETDVFLVWSADRRARKEQTEGRIHRNAHVPLPGGFEERIAAIAPVPEAAWRRAVFVMTRGRVKLG